MAADVSLRPPAAGAVPAVPTLHAAVISWPRTAQTSRAIAAALQPQIDRLTVVYSNPQRARESGCGDWVQVPDHVYFGGKFLCAAQRGREDVLLLIHADAQCGDWGALARRCRAVLGRGGVGVWAPAVSHTHWVDALVELRRDVGSELAEVAQTDCVVFALARPVVDRLLELDYARNNLGWGIDWAAICHSHVRGLQVLRDHAVGVQHLPGRGYETGPAMVQMRAFLAQLTPAEQLAYRRLAGGIDARARQAPAAGAAGAAEPTLGLSPQR